MPAGAAGQPPAVPGGGGRADLPRGGESLNAVDVVILALLAFGVLTGFRQGFIVQIASILGAVIALTVAKLEYGVVRALLETVVHKPPWVTAVSYLLIFVVIWMAIVVMARKVRFLVRLLFLGWADRLAGAVLGLLTAALTVELLLYLGKRMPSHQLHRLVSHSVLAPGFLTVIPWVNRLFPHVPR